MPGNPFDAKARWLSRFDRARADLLDGRHILDVRGEVAHVTGAPAVLGSRVVLGNARRVGVFAGSFNPLTVAHAAVAEAARTTAGLDLLMWAMARVTVDKEGVERATVADRAVQLLAYCRAAAIDDATDDAVMVLDAGLYADQAEAVRCLIAPDAELWLIVGFDKMVQLLDPRYYTDRDATLRRLFAAAGLLVAPRAGHAEPDLAALMRRAANRRFAARVRYLPVPDVLAQVASTEARRLLANFSVPDSEAAYDRLASILTPEGAALGVATGAYRGLQQGPDGHVVDLYAARSRWLDSLTGTA